MNKVIISGSEARQKVFEGIEELYTAVSSTLGPHGDSVIIEQPYGNPIITKDGVTVAREISFKDPYKNLGVQLMQQVAGKTDQLVGDGTTTSTILAYELYKCCKEYLDKDNSKKLELLNTLDKAKEEIIKQIMADSVKIVNKDQLSNVALISSNSDKEIADLIVNAFELAGSALNIQVDINTKPETELRVSDGMKLLTGFCTPHFINQKSVSECVFDSPVVFITEDNILSSKDAARILNNAINLKKPLLVFCPVCAGEALQTFVLNKERGVCECCVVQFPQFGIIRTELIEDLCAITGATSITIAKGKSILQSTPEDFGKLKRSIININKTNLIRDPDFDKEKLDKIIADVKEKLSTCNIAEAPKYSMRLERLCGTIVEVLVGGQTEVEVKERKDRIVDSIGAVRAAVEEGIVAGGGVELVNISGRSYLNKICEEFPKITEVLGKPFELIIKSAGITLTQEQEDLMIANPRLGFNAYTREFADLFDLGIVDPAKVTRTAVANAFSVVKILLSTNVVLINKD